MNKNISKNKEHIANDNSRLEIILNTHTDKLILWGNKIPIIYSFEMRSRDYKDGFDVLFIDFDTCNGIRYAKNFYDKIIMYTKEKKDLEVRFYETNAETYKPGVCIRMPTHKFVLSIIEQSDN